MIEDNPKNYLIEDNPKMSLIYKYGIFGESVRGQHK
jgi:hypothetical protein